MCRPAALVGGFAAAFGRTARRVPYSNVRRADERPSSAVTFTYDERGCLLSIVEETGDAGIIAS